MYTLPKTYFRTKKDKGRSLKLGHLLEVLTHVLKSSACARYR